MQARLTEAFIPCEVTRVVGGAAFQAALSAPDCYDLILLEYGGEAGDGALTQARRAAPGIPVVLICAPGDWEAALAALRQGAADCVRTDLPARLGPAVRRALDEARNAALRGEAEASRSRLGSLVRALLESTAEGILVADLAGRITAYNRKFMNLCGLPEFVLAPMDLERAVQALMEQFEDPASFLDEIRRLAPGREPHGLLRAGPDRVLEGSVLAFPDGERMEGLVLRVRDVTSREKATLQLAERVGTLNDFLVDAREAGTVLWHTRGGALFLSEAAVPLLGLDPAGLPATVEALEALVHPEDRPRLLDALGGWPSPALDLRLLGPGGAWQPTRWTLARDPEGGCRGVFQPSGPALDPALILTEGLRRRWMAQLAASFARAFQAPVQALAETGAGGASAGALGRIQDLLARIASLEGPEPAPGLLLDLSAAAAALRPWAEADLGRGIRATWDLAPGLPLLPADPGRIDPVLVNLLRNAAQAMEGEGALRVATGQEGQGERAKVYLEVTDEGPGIPPRVRERMFDPFFTTREGAAGLGLTVVSCVAESLGGTVEVATQPLKGTTVRLLLPVFPGTPRP